MGYITRAVPSLCSALLITVLAAGTMPAWAQSDPDEFVTGRAAEAWDVWQRGMAAVLAQDTVAAEEAFGALLASEPSPLRVALLEERTLRRTASGGAILLLEQDLRQEQERQKADPDFRLEKLGDNARAVLALLQTGRAQRERANDGWYFASIGRFDVSRANFDALLAEEPDPVALLEFADRERTRHEILLQLTGDPTMGPVVEELLALLREGERIVKAAPIRIRRNIERLGGPPRAFENAVALLKDSGEYAVPFIIEALGDPDRKALTPALIRCLPQIDRPALNPLVVALEPTDDAVRLHAIRALGEIGYRQAVPYLLLRQTQATTAEERAALATALTAIASRAGDVELSQAPAAAFFDLAEQYYDDNPALAADMRLATANVWYWRDGILQDIAVPTEVFNEAMCLRLCEKALNLAPDHGPSLALWLAAAFRREAQLGDRRDETRPEDFPAAAYFAQSAGASYCQVALARGVKDGDPAVALGTIAALRKTAGAASLIGDAETASPLARALAFPHRMVRIQAALALANADPERPFLDYQNLMPVLIETLGLHAGGRDALVIDPEQSVGNVVAGVLREAGYHVITDTGLLGGLQKVRSERPGLDLMVIASDVSGPALEAGLEQFRGEFRFAATPTLIVAKPADQSRVRELAQGDHRLGVVLPTDTPEQMLTAVEQVTAAIGTEPITPEKGLALAKEATAALRLLTVSRNALYDTAQAEDALLAAMSTPDAELKIAVAEVLGWLPSARGQAAMAALALDAQVDTEMRVAMFAALSEAAKRHGNLLETAHVDAVVELAEKEADVVIRMAASQTLGALNVAGNPASRIIRNQHRG